MGFEKYIPFEKKEFRPGQEKAVNDIMDSIESGDKYIILNAPVGIGKSVIAYVIAKYFEEQGKKTYLSTGTKILQDQYLNDFQDVKTIKGRANFNCAAEPLLNCAKGMCQTNSKFACGNKPILKEAWYFNDMELPSMPILDENDNKMFYGDAEFDDFFLDGMCSYWKQKVAGIMSPITMLNYDYLISDVRFVQHLPYRKLLVCDEGHNIEKILMRQLETKFSPFAVEKETSYKINKCFTIGDWTDESREIAELYRKLMKSTKVDSDKLKFSKKYEKFSVLTKLLEDNPDNWVFTQEKSGGHMLNVFKPITVSQYTNMIFNVASHILIMTGTVLKQDVFAKDLGISDFSYIEVPSIIPISNRPIVKRYVGSMATSAVAATMPHMIAQIKMIADNHYNQKGVIHTFTYKIARAFEQAFKDDERYVFHNQKNKEEMFTRFKMDKTNKILVSPVAFEGVDFPYDQARWQCICKEPFPNMRDPQISTRDKIDFDWVFRQRCLVLSQMYGRTNRAPDDYSITYLLDSRIESLLGPSSLVTDYFYEALEGSNYNTKLVLQENAYDKLTKDNSRKNHTFDRSVEQNILKDIEDGYDTLRILRSEYKKFSSDAYKYITPAVERLLKHGAIRYDNK